MPPNAPEAVRPDHPHDGTMIPLKSGLLLLIAVLIALAASCGLPRPAAALSGRISLEVGGTMRTALVVQHERLKKSRRAVVIVLHGGKGFGARLRHNLGLEDIIGSSSPVMVYPNAIGGNWNVTSSVAGRNDSEFIADLIAKLVTDGIADRHRIFLVGSSSGGLMALRLACEHSSVFTGAAILIASLPAELAQSCHLAHPLPFLLIAGTADPFIPYKGGKADLADNKSALLAVEDTVAIFAQAAHCEPTKTTTEFPHHDAGNETRAYLVKFDGCKAPVEFVRVEGGGHTIPGRWKGGERGRMMGPANDDFDSALLIWELFRKARG
jgi:polyhydroxybutyrate depolymerase